MRSRSASRFTRGSHFFAAVLLAASLASCGSGGAGSTSSSFLGSGGGATGGTGVVLKQLSTDTSTNTASQHLTEAGPAVAVFNSTLVSAFQVGLIVAGGASDIGFATSTNGGESWSNGLLPGITAFNGGHYDSASDVSVAFDQAHMVWIIASRATTNGKSVVLASRSTDGQTWNIPILVSTTGDAEKDWIACDNNPLSSFFGHCYLEWDDPSSNNLVWLSTSDNGGNSWTPAINVAGRLEGVGGRPVVSANGLVIVPIMSTDGTRMLAFSSGNGGASWTNVVTISTITTHTVAGNLQTSPQPSAAVDGAGKVYVVWQDCRFQGNCSSNDIVLSTSSNGINWLAPIRIAVDGINTHPIDHFLPALAASSATSGASAQLALTYYFYSNATCSASTCQLNVGFTSSSDGGVTWSTSTTIAGPMQLAWLAQTTSGVTVGDYTATTYSNAQARAVFTLALTKLANRFNQAIYTATNLTQAGP
jgi:hypothetical protein